MDQERRKFLRGMAAACATGIAHNFKIGATLIAGGAAAAGTAASAASTTSAAAAVGAGAVAVAAGAYGTGVRAQVFEVIVRQAIAGAPWKEICQGPMQVNAISPDDVEREILRRKLLLHDMSKAYCQCTDCGQRRLREFRETRLKYEAKLAAIPHSDQSPCGCNACFKESCKIRDSKTAGIF